MPATNRLLGIDFAYVLAILGIIIYTYTFTVGGHILSGLSHSDYYLFLDVFPAIFFFLNGLTVTLTMRDRRVSSRKLLSYLGKRGSVLFMIGLATCVIWPMNIFIPCGLMYFSAPYMAQWNTQIIRVLIILLVMLSMSLLYLDVPTYVEYTMLALQGGGFIDLGGFIFFNGYFSILPWFIFFLAGLLHGRVDLRPRGWLPPSSLLGLVLIGLTYFAHVYAKKMDTDGDTFQKIGPFLVNTKTYLPSFVCFATGCCIVGINFFIFIFRKFSQRKILRIVQTLSSMKYSMLFFQVLIGIITLSASNEQFFTKKIVLIVYVILATWSTIWITLMWRKKVNELGPMEWLIKRISGSSKR